MQNARLALLEAILVAVFGLSLALVANALSPRGLRLSRNYFPGGETSFAPTPARTNSAAGRAEDGGQRAKDRNQTSLALEATLQRFEQRGLHSIGSNLVEGLVHDLRYAQGLVVLIDARDDPHYQAGHIPGAWQFDHYHSEQYLPTILPVCLNAQQVVVYCTGGTCEDSEFAAIMLREAGVPSDRLFIYTGGITEWMQGSQPVETGARQSGVMSKPNP